MVLKKTSMVFPMCFFQNRKFFLQTKKTKQKSGNLNHDEYIMKKLILMRHGDAPMAFSGDHERELSASGMAEVEITACYIKSNYKIDRIICSIAKRNKQTLDVLQKHVGVELVEFSDDIYKNDLAILQSLVSGFTNEAETILLLGHNPSLLLFALKCDPSGYDEWHDQMSQGLRTAEIIVIECDEYSTWEEFISFGGKIRDIFIP